jgi:hypothetical protein
MKTHTLFSGDSAIVIHNAVWNDARCEHAPRENGESG